MKNESRPGCGCCFGDESIEVVPVPLAQVQDMIRSGEIEDAKTIAALLMAIHVYGDSL